MKNFSNFIFEGDFSWFSDMFAKTQKFKEAYKKRHGKLMKFNIDDVSKLQVSKPIKGSYDSKIVKNITDSGFKLFSQIYKRRKEYFADNDGKEMQLESLMYVYTPETPLGSDEKYIMGLGIKANKELIEGFVHIVDFEISDEIKNGVNIANDLFAVYLEHGIKAISKKGVTIKYVGNPGDFKYMYNNKQFEIADETQKLMKLEF